jgi:hypothetical protein
LHHFVAKSDWSDRALLAAIQRQLVPAIERPGPIEAWIIDDTGFPKKGKHSVGVARQFGRASPGVPASRAISSRALPPSASARHIVITNVRSLGRNFGF